MATEEHVVNLQPWYEDPSCLRGKNGRLSISGRPVAELSSWEMKIPSNRPGKVAVIHGREYGKFSDGTALLSEDKADVEEYITSRMVEAVAKDIDREFVEGSTIEQVRPLRAADIQKLSEMCDTERVAKFYTHPKVVKFMRTLIKNGDVDAVMRAEDPARLPEQTVKDILLKAVRTDPRFRRGLGLT